MLPHKTARGAAALGRLKVFEGIPAPYDTTKKQYIPDAMRCVKLASFRKFCTLGDLSSQVGWGKQQLVEQLETKRKDRALNWHKKRIEKKGRVRQSANAAQIAKLRAELAQYGYWSLFKHFNTIFLFFPKILLFGKFNIILHMKRNNQYLFYIRILKKI